MADVKKTVLTEFTASDRMTQTVATMRGRVTADLKSMALGFVGVSGAIAGVSKVLSDSIRAYAESERVMMRVNRAGFDNVDAVTKQADALRRLSGIEDEVLLSTAALARAFVDDEKSIRLAEAAMETAAATGKSYESVSQALIKSLSGNVREIKFLIPEIGALTKEQLANGGAVDALIKKYGGASGADAGTLAGSMTRLRGAFSAMQEEIGGLITGSGGAGSAGLRNLTDVVERGASAMARFREEINKPISEQSWIVQILSTVPGLNSLAQLAALNRGQGAAAAAGGSSFPQVGDWMSGLQPGFYPPGYTGDKSSFPGSPMRGASGGGIPVAITNWDVAWASQGSIANRRTMRGGRGGSTNWDALMGGPVDDPGLSIYTDDDIRKMETARALAFDMNNVLVDGFQRAILSGENFFASITEGFKRMLVQLLAQQAAKSVLSLLPVVGPVFAASSTGSRTVAFDPAAQRAARRSEPSAELARRRGQIRG